MEKRDPRISPKKGPTDPPANATADYLEDVRRRYAQYPQLQVVFQLAEIGLRRGRALKQPRLTRSELRTILHGYCAEWFNAIRPGEIQTGAVVVTDALIDKLGLEVKSDD